MPDAPSEMQRKPHRNARGRIHLTYLHGFFLALLTIPALWPLYTDGLPARFDRGLHMMRLAWLDQHIHQGTLFPRWVPEMMLGRGYPLFNFYGAGVYYLSELFVLLGLNLSDASVATLTLLVLLAGAGIYLWSYDIFRDWSGIRSRAHNHAAAWGSLVTAIAYVYAPYFLTVNIYQRGAIAEATAQALMPWVLWSVRRVFTSAEPRAAAHWATLLALLLSALVFSHTLMLLIFPPFLAGYVLILWLQTGRSAPRLGWAVAGLAVAVGMTAFFWLPLVFERDNLSKFAYGIVRGAFLPRSTWTWETFFAKEWLYTYVRPPRLGLVQFLLGACGTLLLTAWQRRAETWYLLGAALVAGLLVGGWSRPLWESSEILLSIQSPWRLLTLISLVLAVGTGALVAYLPGLGGHEALGWGALGRGLLAPIVAVVLAAVMIYTNLPRVDGLPFFSRTDTDLPRQMLAQLEYEQGVETGGEGSTFVQEFRPVWASRSLLYTGPADLRVPAFTLQPIAGSAYQLTLDVTVDVTVGEAADEVGTAPLRFNQFYFPGWEVRLDGDTHLPTYPSTNVGLLTVDVPPGRHTLALAWTGTPLQRTAGAVSMVTLALLAGFVLWRGRRVVAVIPLLLLVLALFATYNRPATTAIAAPTQSFDALGLRLLGYRTAQSDATHIYLYPYWYLTAAIHDDNLRARWQLQDTSGTVRDASGTVRAEIASGPYFNASTPRTWPPGTLLEDAYLLPLPPGLPAGDYTLVLQVHANATQSEAVPVGMITLAQDVPRQAVEMIATRAQFDDEVLLAGYRPPRPDATGDAPTVFHAGEDAVYRLYWRALKTPSENYHSYVHLIDAAGNAIYQSDQLPGPWFRPPKGWDTYYLQQDTHVLEIPPDAPGGLYWPSVGMYEIHHMDRMAVTVDGEPVPGDVFRLPPVKVIGAPAKPPIAHAATFAAGFRLLGYALETPEGGLFPGARFTVKLYYRSDTHMPTDYTRFFHLYNPDLGLAAQSDSPPQGGVNPTSAWVAGETIVDTVTLQVAEDAAPGEYRLFTGFYDAAAGGVRVPVQDAAGKPLPDDGVVLDTVTVQAQPAR